MFNTDTFIDVESLTLDELQRLIGQIRDEDAFEMIYDGIDANVWRHFRASQRNTFAVRFFAEHCEYPCYAFTQGVIKCEPEKVYNWEKTGKRKLINFMRDYWNVHF